MTIHGRCWLKGQYNDDGASHTWNIIIQGCDGWRRVNGMIVELNILFVCWVVCSMNPDTVHACLLSCFSPAQPCAKLWIVSPRLLCPWDSLGKNTGVGCHALLQGIFPTPASNPGLMSPALAGGFFTTSATWEALKYHKMWMMSLYLCTKIISNI